MDRCPTETLQHIFGFACTDGGRTGRSLSLVSSHIRMVSKPYLLQSLQISGEGKIIGFSKFLSHTPPELRKIRYLFISCDQPRGLFESDADRCRRYLNRNKSPLDPDKRDEMLMKAFQHGDHSPMWPTVEDSLIHILSLVSDTLCTLELCIADHKTLFPPLPLPSLVELTIWDSHNPGSIPAQTADPVVPYLPALRRLRLGPNTTKSTQLEPFFRYVAQNAPGLTHLYLHETARLASYLPASLGLIDMKSPLPYRFTYGLRPRYWLTVPRLPTTLRQVVVERTNDPRTDLGFAQRVGGILRYRLAPPIQTTPSSNQASLYTSMSSVWKELRTRDARVAIVEHEYGIHTYESRSVAAAWMLQEQSFWDSVGCRRVPDQDMVEHHAVYVF